MLLQMLACEYEHVGGRDLDHLLATHFAEEFKTKYRVSTCNTEHIIILVS